MISFKDDFLPTILDSKSYLFLIFLTQLARFTFYKNTLVSNVRIKANHQSSSTLGTQFSYVLSKSSANLSPASSKAPFDITPTYMPMDKISFSKDTSLE